MERHRLRLLSLAALAMVAWAAFVLASADHVVSRAPPGEKAIPGLADKLGELAWMRIVHGTTKANFSLIGDRWAIVEKGNYPANNERVRKLLLGLADLTMIEPKTDRVELLPRLDLDDPVNGKSTLVALQDRTGALLGQLVIGRRRPNTIGLGEAGVYVRRADSSQAWLARGSFDLAGDVSSWLDRRVIDLPVARIASVVLTAADGTALTLSRAKPEADFAVEGAPEGTKFKDQAALSAPARMMGALDFDDVKPAVEFAIPPIGVATAAFTTFDGVIVGVRLLSAGDTDWAAFDATGFDTGEAEAAALSKRLSRWTFAIPADKAKLLRSTLVDLTAAGGS